jgi:hypothetical protein
VKHISGRFSLLEADILGNIYAITPEGNLIKYNAGGDSLSSWNNVKALGSPTALDVSNPMRILLYYQPFATLVILDRWLIQRNTINLRKSSIFSVRAIANAYDNSIWLFDEQDFKIKKLNERGELLFESADWRMLFPESPTPTVIRDAHNTIYLYDPKQGIYLFDFYGSFKKKIPFTGMDYFGMTEEFFYGLSGLECQWMTEADSEPQRLALPSLEGKPLGFRLQQQKMYILNSQGISIFKINTR